MESDKVLCKIKYLRNLFLVIIFVPYCVLLILDEDVHQFIKNRYDNGYYIH